MYKKIKNKIYFLKNNNYTTEQLGIIFLSFGTILQAIIQILILSILSRLLTSSDFGIITVLQSITTFSLMFSQFGVSQVIIQKEEVSKEEISTATSISIVFGTIISILFFVFSKQIGLFFNSNNLDLVIKFFAPYFFLKSFFLINEGLLLRDLNFRLVTKIQIISYFFGYGLVSVIFALNGFGYWSIVIGLYTQMIISGILQSNIYGIKISFIFDKKVTKNLLYNGGGYTSATFLNYLTEEMDNFFVGRKLGIANLGVYNRAFSLYSLASRFFGIVYDKVYFPLLSKKVNDNEYLKTHYVKSISLSSLVLTPLSLLIYINAELIVEIFLGSKWDIVVDSFKILSLSIPFRFGIKISKNLVKSMNMSYNSLYLYLIFILLMFTGLYFALMFNYGLKGVAFVVLITNLINHLQFIYFLSRKININCNQKFKMIVFNIVLLLPFLILYNICYSFFIKNILLYNLIFSLIYFIIVFLFIKFYIKKII